MKRRRARPALLGAFFVGGLVLVALAVIALGGENPFTRRERAVMHFSGSVYGLAVGAPVVFRGVRVGSVASIDVRYDRASDRFSIPVVAELDGDAVSGLDGRPATPSVKLALPALVQRGLSAQLQMQSLLTGLLYVDLDLRPTRERSVRGGYPGLVEIPTTANTIQAIRNQLEEMDLKRVAQDLSEIAASARAAAASPEFRQAVGDIAAIAAAVKRVSQRLDRRIDPLADELGRSLAATRAALDRVGQAAGGVDRTAMRVGDLLAPDAPLAQNLQAAVEEVARTAAELRRTVGGDSTLMHGSERALADVSRAARALRQLAETLEQQPEALLRGRRATP